MKNTIKYDDLIYDVGMHIGEDTDFYLKKGFRVIAFEANPELVKLNQKKFEQQIKNKKLVIISGAIIENPESDKVKFYVNKKRTVWGTVDPEWVARNEKTGAIHEVIEVNAIDFAKCIEVYGIPYYMKIDIEGADLVCLNALKNFSMRPSYISVESEKVIFSKLVEEIALFECLGYNKFVAVQQGNIKNTKVPKPAREGVYVMHKFIEGASGLFGRELTGEFKAGKDILTEYESIFHYYNKFGDNSFWRQNKIGRLILTLITKITNKPLPGWYDTHAMHSSVDQNIDNS